MGTLHRIFDSCMDRINQNEFPQGSAERMQFVKRVFGNKILLLMKADEVSKETAFHLAVSHKSSEVVQVLIDEARSLDSSSANNELLQTLLRQPDYANSTALHEAVKNDDMEIAKLLAEADSNDTHIQNITGETPIYTAARLGYNDIVKMICTTCTAPAFDGPDGTTALHAAISKLPEAYTAGSDVVEVILEAAKRKFSTNDSFEDFIRKADYKSKNTALHLAVRGKHLGVVRQILMEDPLYRATDKNSDLKTPLYIAAEQGYVDIVKKLCKRSFSIIHNLIGPQRRNLLHAAVLGRSKDCVKMIADWCNCLVSFPDEVGWTPLHYAAHYKFDSAIEALLRFPDRYPFTTPSFQHHKLEIVPTPLWLATEEGHTSTVIILMKLFPDFCDMISFEDGRNVLHLAADQSDKEMIYTILIYCPLTYLNKLLNGKDKQGNTPLHSLISKGCFVKELIEHKEIDRTTRNNNNWTPFDMLYLQDHIEADQLKIKKAIDHTTRATRHSNFWHKSSKVNSSTQDSFVPPRIRSKKNAKFKILNKKLKKEKLERYKERTNTQIIVTALITTVTFTVGFTMPGGYYQSGDSNEVLVGLALLSKKTAFIAFMVSDAIALALSTISLFLYFISSLYEDPQSVSKLNFASAVLNIVSVIAMMSTFIAGTYVVLSNSPTLALTVCIICSTFFVCIIVLLIKLGYDRKKVERESSVSISVIQILVISNFLMYVQLS